MTNRLDEISLSRSAPPVFLWLRVGFAFLAELSAFFGFQLLLSTAATTLRFVLAADFRSEDPVSWASGIIVISLGGGALAWVLLIPSFALSGGSMAKWLRHKGWWIFLFSSSAYAVWWFHTFAWGDPSAPEPKFVWDQNARLCASAVSFAAFLACCAAYPDDVKRVLRALHGAPYDAGTTAGAATRQPAE